MKEVQYYQTVTLVMADGRKCVFAGRTQLDPWFPPRVTEILVSRPQPLPEGCSFDTLPAAEREQP